MLLLIYGCLLIYLDGLILRRLRIKLKWKYRLVLLFFLSSGIFIYVQEETLFWSYGGSLLVLYSMCLYDLRTREIPDQLQAVLFIMVMLNLVINPRLILSILFSLIPGAAMMVLFFKTEYIGGADGKMMMSIGMSTSITGVLNILLWACIGACLCYLPSLIKRDGQQEIPFIPFLSFGVICQWLGLSLIHVMF